MKYFYTKTLLSCFALLLFSFSAFSQNINLLWAKQLENATNTINPKGMKLDNQGNGYFFGDFVGTTDFDPGPGTFNLTAQGRDAYILKLDPFGNFIWVKQFKTNSVNTILDLDFDSVGNIYATGYFDGTTDFDPGAGTFNLISTPPIWNIFILRLDISGDFIWVKQLRSNGEYDYGYSIEVDNIGNVYVGGYFNGSTDFDPSSNNYFLSNAIIDPNIADGFILKLDNNGNFIWVKQIGGMSVTWGYNIELDSQNNIYLSGDFEGTADFDPGAGVHNLTTSELSPYIVKLNSSGDFVWAGKLDYTTNNTTGSKIILDNLDNIYLTNTFSGTIDFDWGVGVSTLTAQGIYDTFILKLNPSGNFEWVKSFGGNSTYVKSTDIALDNMYNTYIIGAFTGTTDFNPHPTNTHFLTSAGGNDIFMAKLNSTGDFEWAKRFGSNLDSELGVGIEVNNANECFMIGEYRSTVDFDPNIGVTNLIGSTIRGNTFFVKYKQCPVAGFSPSSLPFAVLGETYNQTLSQTVLNGSVSWVLLEGSLPSGMSFNTSTGVISGTPTVAGTYNFIIEATNGVCSDTKNYSIVVGCPTASISPDVSSLPTALQSQPYSQTLTQTGLSGTITWSRVSGSLPTSFNLNPSTGVISSTYPNVLGNFTFTVRASNGFCSVDRVYSINVVCPTIEIDPPTLSDATQGIAYNANFAQTGLVGINITWAIISGGLPTGITLNSTTGVIAGTANSVGTYNFTVRVSNGICSQTKAYTLRVICPNLGIAPSSPILNPATQGINYTQTFTATGITFGTALWTFQSGTLPIGITFNSTTGQISGNTMMLGTYSFSLKMENGSCSVIQNYTFDVICPTVNISPITLPIPLQGLPYNQTLSQNQMVGNITWSVVNGSLPTGLTLNSSTGEISGVIPNTNSFTFTIQVSNGICSTQKTYTIQAACPTGKINPNVLPNGKRDVSYNQRFTQQGLGGTMNWQIVDGTLPTGLALNSSTGVLSGIPTLAGNYTFRVRASNGACNTEQEYPLVIETPTSISSNIYQGGFKIYPNPTEKELWIEIENGKTLNDIEIMILDVWGRKLEGSYTFKQLNSYLLQITTENLPSGVYILQVQTSSSIPFVTKFVKK